ncbi:MAG: hypothetical protein WC656_02100 [Sulfurimonas sp.]|jgi:predicted transposase YbfD/YdcC
MRPKRGGGNEIQLVRKMILKITEEGLIYTIDALHTQKETFKTIIDNYCDYIVGVDVKKLYEILVMKQPWYLDFQL